MRKPGRAGRTFANGTILAAALALLTWWLVSGLAICPAVGDLAAECRAEAGRIGLNAAAAVAAFVVLVTAAAALLMRWADRR